MADFDHIITQCIDDIWKHLNCDSSTSLDKDTVKKIICTMDANNEYISDDFERAFTEFGKNDRSTMTK